MSDNANKNSRLNQPHWHLVTVLPLLVFLVTEDEAIMRGLGAVSLSLTAIAYGRGLAERAQAASAADRDISN
ncbi:hypothetical protein [Streptomyces sp. NPDC001083]|uniref:hypothetical protein n=1 Tax=Streptomyces sp. NPDC001083 TaxID=3364545 RepID=UPI0036B50753